MEFSREVEAIRKPAPKDIPWISQQATALFVGVTFVVRFVLTNIKSASIYVREAILQTIQAWLGKTQCIDCLVKDVELARANERTAHAGEKSLNWQKLWREEQERAGDLQAKIDELSGISRAGQSLSSENLKPISGFQSLRSRTQQATRESLEKRNRARANEEQ
jgi:hypothetical protein